MRPDPFQHLDAAYLMDALEPADRAEYEAHLRQCEVCRGQVELIRPTADLLGQLDRDDLFAATGPDPALAIPDTVLPRLLAAASRRQPRRRAVVAALSALVAAASIAFVVMVPGSSPPAPAASPMVALASSAVSATVALKPTAWGTQIDLTCWYRDGTSAPTGYRYALTVTDKDGDTYTLGDWQLKPGAPIVFHTGTALSASDIKQIDIVTADGTKLLERRS